MGTLWRCEQVWAGMRFNGIVFHSREEAEKFVTAVLQTQPDQLFSIEEIRVDELWN